MIVKRCLIAAVLLMMMAGLPASAQERTEETTPRVQALDSFHEVIARIWHEAWPQKNTALLKQLIPQVEKGIAEVASAPLPGILRDKKPAWDEGVKKLKQAGSEYSAAAAAQDDAGLLDAAEKLHSRFEALIRVIRPALKELDDFHAVLYMLYHYHFPKNDLENIRLSAAALNQKMSALNAAALPARLKQKDPEFQSARAKLSTSVANLESAAAGSDQAKIKAAVESVHSDYQSLERIF